jgi:hypothetical protein
VAILSDIYNLIEKKTKKGKENKFPLIGLHCLIAHAANSLNKTMPPLFSSIVLNVADASRTFTFHSLKIGTQALNS